MSLSAVMSFLENLMSLSGFTGIAFIVAGLLLLYRELLLDPANNASFPCAPLVVRAAMFTAGVGSVGVGALFVFHVHLVNRWGHVVHFAGDAALPVAMLSVGVLGYQAVLLLNLWHERRPKKVWEARARIDRKAGFPSHSRAA